MAEAAARPLARTPRQLSGAAWKFALRRCWRNFWDHQCTDLAAGLTYYGVLGVFPGLIVLISLLGTVGQGAETVNVVLEIIRRVAPASIGELVEPILNSLVGSRHGFGLIAGIVGALYTISRYVRAFGRALNRIYDVREGRPVWRLEARMLVVTVIFGVLVIVAIGLLLISGPVAEVLGRLVGVGATAVVVATVAKWPAVVLVAVVVVAILYYATPNVHQTRWRWVSIGAIIALVLWSVAAGLFGLYVANFARYDATYGSLAGVIVFLVWLWVTNLAVLIGAVVDCELQRARELQAGLSAMDGLSLPLRDIRLMVTMAHKEDATRDRAAALMAGAGEDDRPGR